MRSISMGTVMGLSVTLAACGDITNERLREGDVTGLVLRADEEVGLVVLLADEPRPQELDDDGRFRLSSVPGGAQEILVVASATEAIRLPALVVPRETTDLGTIDPRPGAFLRVDLVTSREPGDYRLQIERTHLKQVVPASPGVRAFIAGPLGAGCYWAQLTRGNLAVWRAEVCLAAGETRAVTVTD